MKNNNLFKLTALTLIISLVSFVLPGFSSPVYAYADTITSYYVDTPSGVNVRTGAGTQYEIICAIPNGTVFQVFDINGVWGKTKIGGREGYICLTYCSPCSSNSFVNSGPHADYFSDDMEFTEGFIEFCHSLHGLKADDFGFSSNWCAWFIQWIGDAMGFSERGIYPYGGSYGTVTDLLNWFINNKKGCAYYFRPGELNTSAQNAIRTNSRSFVPEVGDLLYFTWSGVEDERFDHIGIVLGFDSASETVYFCHGNTNGNYNSGLPYWETSEVNAYASISIQSQSISGFLRPYYYASNAAPEKSMSGVKSACGYVDIREGGDECVHVEGWFYDPTTVSSDLVITIGGFLFDPSAETYTISTAVLREDVNEALSISGCHGFSSVINTQKRGVQPVYVYGYSADGNTHNLPNSNGSSDFNVNISEPVSQPTPSIPQYKEVTPTVTPSSLSVPDTEVPEATTDDGDEEIEFFEEEDEEPSIEEVFSTLQSYIPAIKVSRTKTRTGKKALKISWQVEELDYDVDYFEVFRATAKDQFTEKPYYVSKTPTTIAYTNKKIKAGQTYYYKVRGVKVLGDTKIYTAFSQIKSKKVK